MKMTLEMPQVRQCAISECAYNTEQVCHAKAITIGDQILPMCDTVLKSSTHVAEKQMAGVGSCKVSGCSHNEDFECQAQSISVDRSAADILCMTYENR